MPTAQKSYIVYSRNTDPYPNGAPRSGRGLTWVRVARHLWVRATLYPGPVDAALDHAGRGLKPGETVLNTVPATGATAPHDYVDEIDEWEGKEPRCGHCNGTFTVGEPYEDGPDGKTYHIGCSASINDATKP